MNDLRHDLRHDPDAHAVDRREATRYDLPAVQRIDPADLRTVPMPGLRTAEARQLDAEARDLRTYDQRANARMDAIEQALERIADMVTILMLERDLRREQQPDAMAEHQRRMYAAATVALAATLALGVLMWWLQGGVG